MNMYMPTLQGPSHFSKFAFSAIIVKSTPVRSKLHWCWFGNLWESHGQPLVTGQCCNVHKCHPHNMVTLWMVVVGISTPMDVYYAYYVCAYQTLNTLPQLSQLPAHITACCAPLHDNIVHYFFLHLYHQDVYPRCTCSIAHYPGWKDRGGPKRSKDSQTVHAITTNWENGCSTLNSSLLRVSWAWCFNYNVMWIITVWFDTGFCLSLLIVLRKLPT